jgi:hypothetical protein
VALVDAIPDTSMFELSPHINRRIFSACRSRRDSRGATTGGGAYRGMIRGDADDDDDDADDDDNDDDDDDDDDDINDDGGKW